MAVNSWDEIEKFRGNIVKGEWPTIPELYEMAVKRWPDHISFSVFEPEKKALTFAQAWEKIKKGAAYLRSKGIKKGDRVLLNGKNSPDWAIAFNKGTVKHIFFIAETKGSMGTMELRGVEKAKIECAEKLFNNVSTSHVCYHQVKSYQNLLDMMKKLE